jgi:riboflavin kinase / FMN adenylyltransferase
MGTTKIISQLTDVTSHDPTVLTIGFFDGVHLGHQQLIRQMIDFASQEKARAVLVTFWPHPRNILRPEESIPLLTTREEKLELLAGLGCLDTVIVMPFTSELAQLTPQAYLGMLNKHFKLQGLIEGEDFTFGYNRTGTMTWLRGVGKEAGFAVRTINVVANGNRISSTRIREYIASGRVEEAAELLGRPYTLTGTVIHGDRLGRQLGYPTANLHLDPMKLLPANGIYAVRVQLPGNKRDWRPGVANIGVRPTFGEGNPLLVEVHILDTQCDLYGQHLAVEFVTWLRKELYFPSRETLQLQMASDVDRSRTLLTAGIHPE